MALPDYIGESLDGPITALRRQAISLAVAVAAAIGAVLYAASAAMLALEAALTPIGARAAIAVVLLVIAVAGYFAPRWFAHAADVEPAPVETEDVPRPETMTREHRLAMVFEALLLGFSLGSRKPAASAGGRK